MTTCLEYNVYFCEFILSLQVIAYSTLSPLSSPSLSVSPLTMPFAKLKDVRCIDSTVVECRIVEVGLVSKHFFTVCPTSPNHEPIMDSGATFAPASSNILAFADFDSGLRMVVWDLSGGNESGLSTVML
eukprot:CAMPEP_0182516772 /NCGR_PEP_ID=MMETSP1321-20130603/41008_1 /TAXON_ID=91990 /ORGANISM="Bolidomonas sp., Strain RCC1657" /LENGTH=128 /DNA_ID=CAMNT_0024724419 /DNA_START=161 /DNA_END=544 /DNA_ORIENTATION=+